MSIHRPLLLLLCVSLVLLASSKFRYKSTEAQEPEFGEVINTLKLVEHKAKKGFSPSGYPSLVAEVNTAISQLPKDSPPRVVELLQGSSTAYTLAFKYWQCDQKPAGTSQAICRDRELEKVIALFPHIRRNITRRLVLRPNPPTYLSSSITTTNMLQLLLMQAELNRVDAHLILNKGKFDGVYSSAI